MKQYKESGTQGIGLIPHSWDSKQLGIFFSENRRANSNLESVTALQFKYGEIIQKPSNGRDLSDKDKELLSKYTVIEPGDVVVNGLNLNFDLKSLRIAIAKENGVITSAYIVLRPRKGVNPEYYNYVLKALDFQKILHGMGEGIRLTLSYDELKKLNVPAPDAAIQTAIVSYLDKKCGKIDSLIRLQEQMVEKLKAYKQSVITEAVTKGLDPNAKLVPSGIDWIGEIPEGWLVTDIKKLCVSITDGSHFSPERQSEGMPYITAGDIRGKGIDYNNAMRIRIEDYNLLESQGCRPHKGDILMVKDGATTGRVGMMIDNEECVLLSSVAMLTPLPNVDSNYLMYLIQSNVIQAQIQLLMAGSAMPRVTLKKINSLKGLLIPLNDQHSIASYLDEKCADIDRLIALKQQKIESLKDYKKSVIYEVVTGKTIIE